MLSNVSNIGPIDAGHEDRPRAILYARQSKLNEDGSDASPLMQWEAGESLCAARGYEVVNRFRDAGKSGWDPSTQRDGFAEMMSQIRDGQCDVVVIFALARLTRMGAQEAFAIEKEMRDHGVALVSVREPYLDTSDPIGAGIFAIIAGLAKQESDTKSVFITNTKQLARRAGGHVSGTAPFGFVNEKAFTEDGVKYIRLAQVPEDALVIKEMVALAHGGMSARHIAKTLTERDVTPPGARNSAGINRMRARQAQGHYKIHAGPRWQAPAVLRILRDPRIAGMAADKSGPDKWEIRRDANGDSMHVHDAIISPADWYALQIAISPKGMVRRTYHGGTYMLSGWRFLFSYSGATMSTTITAGIPRYRCNRHGDTADMLKVSRVSIRVDLTDDHVARQVWSRVLAADPLDPADAELLTAAAQRFARQQDTVGVAIECNELEAQVTHTQERLAQVYADRQAGLYKGKVGTAAFTEAVTSLQDSEERCGSQLRELRALQVDSVRLPLDEWIGDSQGDPIGEGSPWTAWTMQQRRQFLQVWVEWVEVLPRVTGKGDDIAERIVIHWAKPAMDDGGDDVVPYDVVHVHDVMPQKR